MPSPVAEPALVAAAAALVAWYERTARELPWRANRDPYRVLVSEVMLQQTRVEAVVPRFEAFVARFPDLQALAEANEQQVLAAWSGLGYYRRARSLRAAAQHVGERHGGELPSDVAELRSLPGVGPYTAAAVAAIAFEQPLLAIDGNVERVLCRLLGITGDARRAATRRQLHDAAAPLLREHAPGEFNQALMDLGARVCRPRAPRCDECPCAAHCAARQSGTAAAIPPGRRQPIADVVEAAAVISNGADHLLFRGQRPRALGDMWEFPTLDSRQRAAMVGEGSDDSLAAELREHLAGLGWPIGSLRHLGEVRHAITTRRIRCVVFQFAGTTAPPAEPASPADPTGAPDRSPEHGWFSVAAIRDMPIAASTMKILELLGYAGSVRSAPPRRARAAHEAGLHADGQAATF